MRKVQVTETETLKHQSPVEASKTSGGPRAPQSILHKSTPRQPLKERDGASVSMNGDVKERLQVKPEEPAKKKPAGTEWKPFKSVDRMGTPKTDMATVGRQKLSLNRHEFMPSMDADDKIQHENAQAILAAKGFKVKKGVLKERGTDDSNEYLYEEVKDKETGDVGLLYRNNHCDRI